MSLHKVCAIDGMVHKEKVNRTDMDGLFFCHKARCNVAGCSYALNLVWEAVSEICGCLLESIVAMIDGIFVWVVRNCVIVQSQSSSCLVDQVAQIF